jgi:pantothenate kinase
MSSGDRYEFRSAPPEGGGNDDEDDVRMHPTYDKIAADIMDLYTKTRQQVTATTTAAAEDDKHESCKKQQLLFIGVAAPPGAGKSSLAAAVARRVPRCAIVPMDGYHYYKKELQLMPNPEEAFARRGSHWTFNSEKFASDLSNLKSKGCGTFPSFNHGVGDPIEGDIGITEEGTDIVIIEGNYLLQPEGAWLRVRQLLDYTYFISCDIDILSERLVRRHMSSGVGKEEAVARARVANNDLPNAIDILTHAEYADSTIASL